MSSLRFSHLFLVSAAALGSAACGGGTAITASGPGAAGAAGVSTNSGGAAGASGTGGGAATGGAAGAAGAAGTGGAGGTTTYAGGAPDPNALRIDNFGCSYAVTGATTMVDGMPIECSFDVLGDPSRQVTLSCEDTQGNPVDCSAISQGPQAVPFGPEPIPLQRAQLLDWANGLAGTTYKMVVVANDGVETVKRTVSIPIVADDGINVAPTIDIDCAGNTSGQVDVTAGETVDCQVVYFDPDPGTFDYSIMRSAGAKPVNYVSTESGNAYFTRVFDFQWKTDASEAGTSATYELTADDSKAPIVKKTIDINVH